MPGRNDRMANWPEPLVVVERTFSISAGLSASTVTPGMTAPLSSRTVPVMEEVCAAAEMGRAAINPARQRTRIATDRITNLAFKKRQELRRFVRHARRGVGFRITANAARVNAGRSGRAGW